MQTIAIKNLSEKYNFIKTSVIGKSLCGRGISALTIGSRKNRVLYAAAFHGMEWINTLIMLRFIEECAVSYKGRTKLENTDIYTALNQKGLIVIPCVNPDGVEIQINGSGSCPKYKKLIDNITANTKRWQANARGVDLNHNFNAGWKQLKNLEIEQGITRPAATRFGGTKPFSEPETIALRNFCNNNKLSHAIAFHSQGREVYCSYKQTPEKAIILGETFAKFANYNVSLPDEIATGGGFKDWLIGYHKIPAITVETGLGKNPLPLSDFMPEYKRIRKALVQCLIL